MQDRKLKVGLISFHNAYNYGAAMQAYGLQEALKEMGVDAEYINYVNEHRRFIYDTKYQIKSAIKRGNVARAIRLFAGSGFISARGRKFKLFYDKYLNKTKKEYCTSEEAKELNGKFDKFIVGSDQVWNCNNNGGDAAYLLSFVEESDKKISYASSFGMDDIPEAFREKYSHALSSFGRIGVRETAGAKLVEIYTGKKAHVVLDPVFLAGVDVWNKIRQDGKVKEEEYIFFYTNRDSQIRDFWNLGYPKGKIKSHILSSFVGIKEFLSKDTSVRVSMAPADFLNEIASAKLVVTASFHCVAFSILFHKQFVVFLTGNRGKDERILNLLHICGLESRIVSNRITTHEIDELIDYETVDNKLKPYLEQSKKYLFNAVFSLPDVDYLLLPTGESKYFCLDDRCSGCMACVAACPVNAISLVENEEGFVIPQRDENKCIDCYRCHNACQVYSPLNVMINDQRYYAVKNVDKIRKESSSGGIFSAISDEILDKNGVICAATMTSDFIVKHDFAENKLERDKMRGTFYVQSDMGDVYQRIERYLEDGKIVLFVGTPCQVAGVYKALAGKKIEKLITCDLICHGIPSPGVFKQFIEYIKNIYPELTEFKFRDKECGWKHGYTVTAKTKSAKIVNTQQLQSFSKMFSRNIINRRSCANCAYTNYYRVGDITIGDCWGIEKTYPQYADSLGVSLVIVNTKKGRELFDKCSQITKMEISKPQTKQNSLVKHAELPGCRMNAFRILNILGYEALAKKYGDINAKGRFIRIFRTVIRK